MNVGDRVYHPKFREEGQWIGSGTVIEVDERDVFVEWDDEEKEWYDLSELKVKINEAE